MDEHDVAMTGMAISMPEENLPSRSEYQIQALKDASAVANEIAKIILERHLSVKIGAKDHVFIEAWLTCARIQDEQPHSVFEKSWNTNDGFEIIQARGWVTNSRGEIVSEATSFVSTEESKWADKPFYARASMAQTRALAKALSLRHRWIIIMAGYAPTPAEEMDGIDEEKQQPPPRKVVKVIDASHTPPKPTPKPLAIPDSPQVLDQAGQPKDVDADPPPEWLEADVIALACYPGTNKKGKPYNRYSIRLKDLFGKDFWATTFDDKHGETAQEAKNEKAGVKIQIKDKPYTAKDGTQKVGVELVAIEKA